MESRKTFVSNKHQQWLSTIATVSYSSRSILYIESQSCKTILKSLSHVWLSVTPWTAACRATLSIGFPRQGYWNGLTSPSPGDLPDPGIEPRSPTLQAGRHFTIWTTREAQIICWGPNLVCCLYSLLTKVFLFFLHFEMVGKNQRNNLVKFKFQCP